LDLSKVNGLVSPPSYVAVISGLDLTDNSEM
jgi:hypothetical protein